MYIALRINHAKALMHLGLILQAIKIKVPCVKSNYTYRNDPNFLDR